MTFGLNVIISNGLTINCIADERRHEILGYYSNRVLNFAAAISYQEELFENNIDTVPTHLIIFTVMDDLKQFSKVYYLYTLRHFT